MDNFVGAGLVRGSNRFYKVIHWFATTADGFTNGGESEFATQCKTCGVVLPNLTGGGVIAEGF